MQEALIRGFLSFQLEYLGAGTKKAYCVVDLFVSIKLTVSNAYNYRVKCNQSKI